MASLIDAKASCRFRSATRVLRCSASGRPSRLLRVYASATLSLPAKEGSSVRSDESTLRNRFDAGQADKATAPPTSPGLDFSDLIGLEEHVVRSRLEDAVTYRAMCSCSPPRKVSGSFNLLQLVSYRDNVTRNLAPTVAHGFANAVRGAGQRNTTAASAQQRQVQQQQQPRHQQQQQHQQHPHLRQPQQHQHRPEQAPVSAAGPATQRPPVRTHAEPQSRHGHERAADVTQSRVDRTTPASPASDKGNKHAGGGKHGGSPDVPSRPSSSSRRRRRRHGN